MDRRRQRAAHSQLRRDSDDYVYTFVEGDRVTFDLGYDFLQCLTNRLYRDHGAAEFTPFFCFLDYPKAELDGLGLSRTRTLAQDQGLCNHRSRQGGQATQIWPPPFLEIGGTR